MLPVAAPEEFHYWFDIWKVLIMIRKIWNAEICVIYLYLLSSCSGQNNAPVCDPGFRTVNVNEDSAVGFTVESIVCTDDDPGLDGTLTYAIVSGNDESVFSFSTTGAVQLIDAVDYDYGTRVYNLLLRISDGGTPPLSYDVTLDVNIISVNEHTPIFDSAPYTVSLKENTAIGSLIYQLTAFDDDTDKDFVSQSTLITVLGGGDKVFVDAVSGAVYLRQALDYETAQSHVINLQIQDQTLVPQKQSTSTLTITVEDVNDWSPICGSNHFSAPIRTETDPVDTDIQDMACTDKESRSLRYVIETGNALGKFKIHRGVIKLAAQIDVDTEPNAYTLVVAVKDRGSPVHTSTLTIEVFVNGVDDNPVVWDTANDGVYEVSLAENSPQGTFIAMISATDADLAGTPEAEITYAIEDTGSIFGIEENTGRIFLAKGSLDREVQETHVIATSAFPTYNTAAKILGNVTVTLNDVNDNPPVWAQSIYTVTVGEDEAVNSGVLTVAATDQDKGANAQIQYVITAGHTAPGCNFVIDAASGVISNAAALDYESTSLCELTLQARDGGSPALAATANAVISITGVNEFTPTFTGTFTANVGEDAALGTTVYTITATDGDSGLDGILSYILTSHTSVFSIEVDSGKIVLVNGLDRETVARYEVVVEASDKSATSKKTGTATVTFNVDDVNEFAPSCSRVFKVDATLPITIGDTVQALGCTDSDAGVNAQLKYSIANGNTNTDFAVTPAGNVVYNKQPTQNNYQLQIQVSDSGTSPKTTTTFIVVAVESDPQITNLPDTANIIESANDGTVVFTVTGNAASGQKKFSIISGNTGNKFVLDAYTGDVMVLASLDREATASYTIGIRITDVVFSRTADSTLTITVDDANDGVPTFPSTFFDLSVAEDLAVNTVIKILPATDTDAGNNAVLTYSITNGNAAGKFSFTAGQLTLVASLDAETTLSYTLTLEASDGGSPSLTGTTIVVVKVQNVDEFNPDFLAVGNTYTHSRAEDTALGLAIFTVTAQDQDVNSQMSYSITGGNDGTFVIDHTSGSIFLSQFLDRETNPSYSLTIVADNGHGDTVSATLDLTVTDVNDNDPKFSQNVYPVSVNENQPVGSKIGQVVVSDADKGMNGNVLLSIVNGNTGSAFRLDGSDIEVNTALDFETLGKYVLLIEGKDQGIVSRSVTATVVIDVTPTYAQPRFASTTPSVSITEVTSLNTVIYDADATASGAVEGSAGDLDYVILSGNSDGKFSVHVHSGEVLVIGSLDRDTTSSYTLTIQATNRHSTALRDAMTLTISLTDVNDNAPVFSPTLYSFRIDEDATVNDPVGTVTASDVDDGPNKVFAFALSSGEGLGDFTIDATSGLIKVNSALSASSRSSYALKVTATDTGTPPMSSTADVVININDLNDQTPTFDKITYRLQVSELVTVGQVIYILQATDGDLGANGAVSYRILNGNNDLKFSLNSNDGYLKIISVLDRETIDNYNLIVIAEDAGSPQNTGTATVTITVLDANDNKPVYGSGSYHVTVGRTDPIGTSLVQLTTTDQDSGVNKDIEYYIVSGDPDDLFMIDKSSGEITTANQLTAVSDTYDVIVHAIDKGIPRLTSATTVHVTIDPPLTPSAGDFTFSASESASVPSPLGTITPDNIHAPGATIHFTILSGNHNGNLAIGLLDGVIKTAKQLDYEDHPNYYLTIHIEDQNNPTLVYNKRCHISLIDVNDNSPTFTSGLITLTLVENSPIGYELSIISASDLDSGVNGDIIYYIDRADVVASSMFSVDNTGSLTVKSVPDFESIPRIAFKLFAEDKGTPVLTGMTSVVVDLIDVNDDGSSSSSTSLTSPYFSFECPTTASTNEVITTLTAADFGLTPTATDTVRFITLGKNVFGVSENSGEFYVANNALLYASTRYIMSMIVKVQTADNNVTGTSAMVRVDTMVPRDHMIILRHSISVSALQTQRNILLVSLQNLFSSDSRVGIWKIQGVSSSFRRRLLADESESIVYVVNDKSTDVIGGIEGTKSFMSQDNILNVVRETADGTPSAVLTTPSFATFPVTSVHPSTGTSSTDSEASWPSTTVGIAVLCTIGASIVLLIVILVTYFLCTRGRQYNFDREEDENHNKKKVPMSSVLSEKNSEIMHNGKSSTIPSYQDAIEPVKPKPVKAGNKASNLDKQKSKQSLCVSMMNAQEMETPDQAVIDTSTLDCNTSPPLKSSSPKLKVAPYIRASEENNSPEQVVLIPLKNQHSQQKNSNLTNIETDTGFDIKQKSIFNHTSNVSSTETWETLLRQTKIGLQSLRSKTAKERWSILAKPEIRTRLLKVNRPTDLVNDTVKREESMKDFKNQTNFIRPVYKTMALEWVDYNTAKEYPKDTDTVAKDPLYIGWTKIFARRIRQNLKKPQVKFCDGTCDW